jgi:hypothetical protein
MTFGTIMWLFGIVGSFGLAGVAAVYFGVIAVPAVVSTIAMRIVEKILACRICLVVLLVGVTGVVSWFVGYEQAGKHYRAREKAAQELSRRADLEAAKDALEHDKKLRVEIEKVKTERDQANAAYIATLAARPSPACVFDSVDVGGSNVVARARGLSDHWLNRWRRKKPAAAAKPDAAGKPAKPRQIVPSPVVRG